MITLRGLVLSKYKTISEFADAVGWKRNKASRIINGIQDPNSEEIQEIVKCLDIDSEHVFVQIFFGPLSTMWISAKE